MNSNKKYKLLGDYIEVVDIRNKDLAITNLLGVSITKKFITSIANIVGTDLSTYKVVRSGQFAYGPVTSRNGEKISIALLDGDDCIISSSYTVFRVNNENNLDPEYLMLWFSRPEFDRYARYKSHGSVREIFGWDELCQVELPVPDITKQREIVKAYKVITDRIALKQKINDNLEATLTSLFVELFDRCEPSNTTFLSEIISFSNGKSRPKTEGNIPVYGGNGILSYTDQTNAENAVLIGRVGAYCGSVYLEHGICWVSDNAIYAKSKICDDEFYDYFLLKGLNLYNHHVGTGQQLLTQEILNKLEIPKANISQIHTFNSKAKSVFSVIWNNENEISELQQLSALLLARLAN